MDAAALKAALQNAVDDSIATLIRKRKEARLKSQENEKLLEGGENIVMACPAGDCSAEFEEDESPIDICQLYAAAKTLWSDEKAVSSSGWPTMATAVTDIQLWCQRSASHDAALQVLVRAGLAARFVDLIAMPYDATPATLIKEEEQLHLTASTAVQYAVCQVCICLM